MIRMQGIKNETRKELLEVLKLEYPDEDESKLEKMLNRIYKMSVCLFTKFLKKKD